MDAAGVNVKEQVSASKKLSQKEAKALAADASKLIVAKGKKVSEFQPKGKPSKEMIEAMLGPTGNLRAPCIRAGKTVLVGFNEEVYQEVFK